MDYLNPAPLSVPLEVRGVVKELKGRKVVIEETISANGIMTVRGEVLAVQMPDQMIEELVRNAGAH